MFSLARGGRNWSAIFKLGTRYSAHGVDENGRKQPIIMGCYGGRCQPSPFSVMEQHVRPLLTKTPKGEYRYAWGINFPKNWHHLMLHLWDSSQCSSDSSSLKLTNRIEEALVNKGYEVLTGDQRTCRS